MHVFLLSIVFRTSAIHVLVVLYTCSTDFLHSLVHMHNGGGGGRVLWEMAEKRLFGVLS